jgi:Domain of unknown function (DUF4423)
MKLTTTFVLGCLFTLTASASDFGNVAVCDNGVFSTDYLLTNSKEAEERAYLATDINDSIQRIYRELNRLAPTSFGKKFNDFYKTMRTNWTKVPYGHPNPTHPLSLGLLPPNCQQKVAVKVIKSNGSIEFNADDKLLGKLGKTDAVQLSYAIVQEFLAGFTNDARVVARVNRMLHSIDLEGMNPQQFVDYTLKLGLVKVKLIPFAYKGYSLGVCQQDGERYGLWGPRETVPVPGALADLRAHAALALQTIEERDITSLTLAMDKASIPAAKAEIKKFREGFDAKFGKGKKNAVYCLGIQLFSLLDKRQNQ